MTTTKKQIIPRTYLDGKVYVMKEFNGTSTFETPVLKVPEDTAQFCAFRALATHAVADQSEVAGNTSLVIHAIIVPFVLGDRKIRVSRSTGHIVGKPPLPSTYCLIDDVAVENVALAHFTCDSQFP